MKFKSINSSIITSSLKELTHLTETGYLDLVLESASRFTKQEVNRLEQCIVVHF